MTKEDYQSDINCFDGRNDHRFVHQGRIHILPKPVVLVGIMGAGKTSIGRLLAKKLGVDFFDSDAEIELASGYKVEDFFDLYGENAFREGESKVIHRLLSNPIPHIVSTGGGAYLHPKSCQIIHEKSISMWIRADMETLLKRVCLRNNRPLLNKGDHRDVLSRIMEDQSNKYQEAAIVVDSDADSPRITVNRAITQLCDYLEKREHDPLD